MRAAVRQAYSVIVSCAMVVGCARPVDPTAIQNQLAEDVSYSVELPSTDADGLRDLIKKLPARLVLVDYWATWCVPCVEQFDATVDLQRRFGDRGLTVITVCLNDLDERAEVVRFLRQHDAITTNLMSSAGADVRAMKSFGIAETIPFFQLYDAEGRLVTSYQGMIDHKEIELSIRQTLDRDVRAQERSTREPTAS